MVVYEDESGKAFNEKTFTGPLHEQLRKVLSYIETNIIKENITKYATKAEAERTYNYPLAAVEEAVANAFYHRSYELQNPIEINCFPDRIEILSYPGPLPPVTNEVLKQKRIIARNYRNRRVGDFLKELKLTEGRSTGFPTIYSSMQVNGSPAPGFETDEDYNYFLAVLPVQTEFLNKMDTVGEDTEAFITPAIFKVLDYCTIPRKRTEILAALELSNQTKNYKRYIEPLVGKGWLGLTDSSSPQSHRQKYFTTEPGKTLIKGRTKK